MGKSRKGKDQHTRTSRGLPVHRGRGVVSNNHRNITSNFYASEEKSGSKTVIEYSKVALLKYRLKLDDFQVIFRIYLK